MGGTYQLEAHASVTLDASGNGTVTLSPPNNRVVWNVSTVAVQGSSSVKIPNATVFLGSTNLGGTYAGTNDSDNVSVMVYPGQQLTVKWVGGDAGASATAYAYGTFTTTGSS